MATLLRHIRFIAGALALACLVAVATPVGRAAAADLGQSDRELGEGADSCSASSTGFHGRGTLPDQKACTLEQPAGRDWRHFHQVTLPLIGAIAILGMLALLVLFYLIRGMVRIEHGRSGRVIVRFSAFERLVHWMTATLLHHPGAVGPQHHVRQGRCCCR